MSRPGPHIEEAELVPADQRAARARDAAAALARPSPKQRVNRAADALVAVVRGDVDNGQASPALAKALEDFDRVARGAL